jgi:hypothetical protein
MSENMTDITLHVSDLTTHARPSVHESPTTGVVQIHKLLDTMSERLEEQSEKEFNKAQISLAESSDPSFMFSDLHEVMSRFKARDPTRKSTLTK